MDSLELADLYDEAARERLVTEPPKRVDAPERTPFERDRARVVHAAASRRLAAKTQVMGPQSDDFVRNRLFQPFASTKPGGFGIGAFEARSLVAAMGGRLSVDSRPGGGTTFSITLPAAEPTNERPRKIA